MAILLCSSIAVPRCSSICYTLDIDFGFGLDCTAKSVSYSPCVFRRAVLLHVPRHTENQPTSHTTGWKIPAKIHRPQSGLTMPRPASNCVTQHHTNCHIHHQDRQSCSRNDIFDEQKETQHHNGME